MGFALLVVKSETGKLFIFKLQTKRAVQNFYQIITTQTFPSL